MMKEVRWEQGITASILTLPRHITQTFPLYHRFLFNYMINLLLNFYKNKSFKKMEEAINILINK